MERRANAIFSGRKRSNFLSTTVSSNLKSEEASSDVKKNRYTFSLIKKGNKHDINTTANCDGKKQQDTPTNKKSTTNEPLVQKEDAEINKQSSSTEQGTTDSCFIVTGLNSNAGKKILSM